MGLDFYISISCLVAAIGLGLSLAYHNHKMLIETHDFRMEIYRKRKKIKNERLRLYLEALRRDQFPERQSLMDGQMPSTTNQTSLD